jgi:hypothetical protein
LKAANGDVNKLKKYFQWANLETAGRYVDYIDSDIEEIAEELD